LIIQEREPPLNMTVEQSNYLLGLEKYIIYKKEKQNTFLIAIKYPMRIKLNLISSEDTDQYFMLDIKEGKRQLKVSLHHQDQNSNIGLLRIDFNGTHLNPFEINEHVPNKFKQFRGEQLGSYIGHIHYNIDGYKPLAWAIPLEFDNFPIKQLSSRNDYINLLQAFFNTINLKTNISFNYQPELL